MATVVRTGGPLACVRPVPGPAVGDGVCVGPSSGRSASVAPVVCRGDEGSGAMAENASPTPSSTAQRRAAWSLGLGLLGVVATILVILKIQLFTSSGYTLMWGVVGVLGLGALGAGVTARSDRRFAGRAKLGIVIGAALFAHPFCADCRPRGGVRGWPRLGIDLRPGVTAPRSWLLGARRAVTGGLPRLSDGETPRRGTAPRTSRRDAQGGRRRVVLGRARELRRFNGSSPTLSGTRRSRREAPSSRSQAPTVGLRTRLSDSRSWDRTLRQHQGSIRMNCKH